MYFLRGTFLLFFTVLIAQGCHSKEELLLVAASANTAPALEEVSKVFEDTYGVKTKLIVSSSGKLASQILEGAPYHLFFSADMSYAGKVARSFNNLPVQKYTQGVLVFWSNELMQTIPWAEVLSGKRKVALANPELAPYGKAAQEFLSTLTIPQKQAGLIYGESISQVNQYIYSDAVDFGFTSRSSVMLPKLKDKGYWITIDGQLHSPIDQGAVVLRAENESWSQMAQNYLDLVLSKEGQEIFARFGYRSLEN